jgi:2-oxo-4-hydroxy-4-carboxy--5-ureidoimidazoline (OHCU) decarboxylase
LNRTYEEKFGFIFIICATGKTSGEMLAALRERLEHDPVDELRIAAAEQSKITVLRLKKLLTSG